MPTATKPSKAGYEFLGYYSSKNGGGTKYYDSNMKSVHTWDKSENGTLYVSNALLSSSLKSIDLSVNCWQLNKSAVI